MLKWKTFAQPPRQGTYHQKIGNSKCQDKYKIKENSEAIVIALSDGLGSLKYSDVAATAVTTSVSSFLLNYDYHNLNIEQLKYEILNECANAIKKYSNLRNINIDDMDCTLLFVVLFRNSSKLIYGQLGDGAIIGVKEDQGVLLSDFNEPTKISSNMTKTILSSDAIESFYLRVDYVNDFVGFFLTTDGLEDELYSRVCKVKKKTEWYFNLISNNIKYTCSKEIEKRWNSLTSEERFGFEDDMSLVAIVQPNVNIVLPDEPTWLCICMHRNQMESSRCENCGKDFLKIYKGINFKHFGGKYNYFKNLNKSPKKELNIILNISSCCKKNTEKVEEKNQQLGAASDVNSSNIPVQHQKSVNKMVFPYVGLFKKQMHIKNIFLLGKISQKIKTICNTTNLGCLLILSLAYGISTHCLLGISMKNESDLLCEFKRLQNENETLRVLNDSFTNRSEIFNSKKLELENVVNAIILNSEKYYYNNGDVYIGQITNGLPNGIGVVYSSEVIEIGHFQDGKKYGEFLLLYTDRHSETRIY